MKEANKYIVFLLLTILVGCAGKLEYTRPTSLPTVNNSIVINKNKDNAWKQMVPMLGKQFFVINNLDKDSGIINISYSGDPERYVDCGRIVSYVKNARGERTYDFPASKSYQDYEIMDTQGGAGLLFLSRKMNLEGRMNIIVEDIGNNQSRITANTRYILTKTTTVRNTNGHSNTNTNSVSFNTGQEGISEGRAPNMICQATGKLEDEVLSLLTRH